MKNILLILLMVLAQSLCAQQLPSAKETFVQENWTMIQETAGDLNKDSLADVAMIIEYSGDAVEGERPRSLLILFKDKKTKLYTLAARADRVILDGQSGGSYGADPFSRMEIKNNVLRIDFDGGSRERWATTHRYRYTDNSYFRVIGATYEVEDQGVKHTYDYNLSNGNVIITTRNSQNKAKNSVVNKKIQLLPIEISEFEPDAVWALLMPDTGKKVDTCILTEVGSGDCYHVVFDCGDFGNAKTFLNDTSDKLWNDLSVESKEGETVVNPKYAGKTFEITYVNSFGTRCTEQGEDTYQLIIGLKLVANANTVVVKLPAIPTDSLFAYVDFNGRVIDRSSNNRKLYALDGKHVSDGKNPVGAYQFNENTVVDIAQPNENFNLPFTIAAWFYSEDQERELQTILAMGRSLNGTGFNFGFNFPGKPNSCYFGIIGTKPIVVDYQMQTSGWHFAAAAIDSKSMKLYVDGTVTGEVQLDPIDIETLKNNLKDSFQTVSIGHELNLDRYFSGTIDNVALYSRALSPNEVTQLWQGTTPGK